MLNSSETFSLIRTAKAEEDLIEIWMYIAVENPEAADRLLDQIEAQCQLLADKPGLGQARPDIATELRYFPVGRYLILYRELSDGVEIVRVVHVLFCPLYVFALNDKYVSCKLW